MKNELRYKDLQLTTLRSFCEVAMCGNFTEAAKHLHLSTPTVWQQVRALERKLKSRLVRRLGRAVELTLEGKLLFEMVKNHVSGLDSLVRLFEASRPGLPQQLTIISTPYLVSYHLPFTTQQFLRKNPGVEIDISMPATPRDITRMVAQGEADLGVTVCDEGDLQVPTLEYEPVLSIQLALLTPSVHPLNRKKKVIPEDLTRFPLILPPAGGYDMLALQRILQRNQIAGRIQPVVKTRNLEVIARYVAMGVGIAVGHVSLTAKQHFPGVKLRILDPELPRLTACLVTRRGAHLSTAATQYCDVIRSTWTSLESHK